MTLNRRHLLAALVWQATVAGAESLPAAALPAGLEIIVGAGQDHGAAWWLRVMPDGKAYFTHSDRPGGSSIGEFSLPSEAMAALAGAIQGSDFFALPQEIKPEPLLLHAPAYWVEVRTKEAEHRVRLQGLGDPALSGEMARFWAVWEAVWAQVPLRPGRDLKIQ